MTTHQRNFPSIDPAKLERLAETAVRVGLQLQPGQDLFLTAPVSALPLARRIVAEAYKAGAGLVTPILSDEEITLTRYRFAPDASFDRAPGWLYEGVGKAFAADTARLSQTAPGLSWSTAQMDAVIWLAAVTTAWVSGLVGVARSPAIWLCESPARTPGVKLAPLRT